MIQQFTLIVVVNRADKMSQFLMENSDSVKRLAMNCISLYKSLLWIFMLKSSPEN